MMDRLLGLTETSWSDAQATLGWRYDLSPSIWALIVLACIVLAAWSYSRLAGPKLARFVLGAFRASILLLAVMLLIGPMLVIAREEVEPDTLLVLVDRSASMQIRDMDSQEADAANKTRISRDEAFAREIERQKEALAAETIGKSRNIVWLGFDDHTFTIDDPNNLPLPDGSSTSLRSAIEQAVQKAGGQPISAIALVSDGQSPQQTGSDLVRRLNQQAIKVFSVPLGAEQTPVDLSVAQVESPRKAFVDDIVPVTVWVDRYPADGKVQADKVTVRLIDEATGELLDAKEGIDPDLQQPIRLTARSEAVGPAKWRVQLDYEPSDDSGELIEENNRQPIELELIDRPLRVVYIEGYPRWEYRYFKNMLVREKSIESSVFLISADRSFVQEGDKPIARLPNTAEEWEPFDVIVIGDVPGDYLSTDQLTQIRDQVATRGAGLLWIGGEYHTPRSYDGTMLANLLPMRNSGSVSRLDPSIGNVIVKPAPLAEQLQVMRLKPIQQADGDEGLWPDDLPRLWWMQQVGRLKPTAEVIAEAFTDEQSLDPLVVRMRYGAGQSLFVASDDIWRWRYARGDYYYQQFWTQFLRMLGRTRVSQDTSRVQLSLSARRVNVQQAVVVTLRITDAMLLKHDLPSVSVVVEDAEDTSSNPRAIERLQLLPHQSSEPSEQAAVKQFQTIWRPGTSGRLRLRIDEPILADASVAQTLQVIAPNDELRQPAPDFERLTWLANQTEGAVVPLSEFASINDMAPNRARLTPNDIREPIWNSYFMLVLIVFLLTVEWIARKVIKLV